MLLFFPGILCNQCKISNYVWVLLITMLYDLWVLCCKGIEIKYVLFIYHLGNAAWKIWFIIFINICWCYVLFGLRNWYFKLCCKNNHSTIGNWKKITLTILHFIQHLLCSLMLSFMKILKIPSLHFCSSTLTMEW